MDKCAEINIDPEIMHGTPVFKGTRVAVDTLFDYLETGSTVAEFLSDFQNVKEEQAMAVLDYSRKLLVTA